MICASWLALGLLIGCASDRSKSTNNAPASPDSVVTNGQTATFGVTAAGTAPLTYQWYFIPSNNANSLLLTNVEVSQGKGTNPVATYNVITVTGGTNGTPFYYQWQFKGTNIDSATNN
jgi:hypothetical protein